MHRTDVAFLNVSLYLTWRNRKKQKENQEDLLKQANENTVRLLKSGAGDSGGAATGRKVSSVEAYRSVDEIPTSRDLAIQVLRIPSQIDNA